MSSDEARQASPQSLDHPTNANVIEKAAHALRSGPVGALVVASIAVDFS